MALFPATEVFEDLSSRFIKNESQHTFKITNAELDNLNATTEDLKLAFDLLQLTNPNHIFTASTSFICHSTVDYYTIAWWLKNPTEFDSEGNPKAIPWD